LLDKQEWTDLDLILGQHGLSVADSWDGSKREYVIAMIQHAADNELQSLHGFLTGSSGQVVPGSSPFKSDRLRLFLSHLSVQRDLVGDVGRALGLFGIDAFVAHDSIDPSLEWQRVIEAGLSDCDAMVTFFHTGFLESVWCDQKIGWVMGRNRPILPLAFDAMPHGFAAKYQAKKCAALPRTRVAPVVVEWLVEQRTLHSRLAASLTWALINSGSWDRTRSLSQLLPRVNGFTDDQLDQMTAAADSNINVSACDISGTPGPQWVAAFVAERRTPLGRAGATWSEGPF
jgi:hypothetical protein